MSGHSKHLPAEERRAATVEAVVELAAEQNPSDITTTAIAQRMGLTQGALFRHFPTKDASLESVMDWVAERLAEQQLSSDVNTRETGVKNGVFVDPFISDEMRDQGVAQTAAIFNGEMTIPIQSIDVRLASADVQSPVVLSHALEPVLQQLSRTGSMKVNPYMAFDPVPAVVTLTPAVDRWVQTDTIWSSPLTQRLTVGSGNMSSTSQTTQNVLLSRASRADEFLRQIEVRFSVSGFGPNEPLSRLVFDGIDITPTAI